MDPLSVQYQAYNQRRLHYSLLFWACLALYFSALFIGVVFTPRYSGFGPTSFFGLIGMASILMAVISWRLHRLEILYEIHLRNIEDTWNSQGLSGIQSADITGKFSSRRLVVLVLAIIALGSTCLCLLLLLGLQIFGV